MSAWETESQISHRKSEIERRESQIENRQSKIENDPMLHLPNRCGSP